MEQCLMSAVYDLSTVKPAHDPELHFDQREWIAYWRGYYFALGRALDVQQLAVERFALYQQHQRAQARKKAIA
jgi:hypothetical protein